MHTATMPEQSLQVSSTATWTRVKSSEPGLHCCGDSSGCVATLNRKLQLYLKGDIEDDIQRECIYL